MNRLWFIFKKIYVCGHYTKKIIIFTKEIEVDGSFKQWGGKPLRRVVIFSSNLRFNDFDVHNLGLLNNDIIWT